MLEVLLSEVGELVETQVGPNESERKPERNHDEHRRIRRLVCPAHGNRGIRETHVQGLSVTNQGGGGHSRLCGVR